MRRFYSNFTKRTHTQLINKFRSLYLFIGLITFSLTANGQSLDKQDCPRYVVDPTFPPKHYQMRFDASASNVIGSEITEYVWTIQGVINTMYRETIVHSAGDGPKIIIQFPTDGTPYNLCLQVKYTEYPDDPDLCCGPTRCAEKYYHIPYCKTWVPKP